MVISHDMALPRLRVEPGAVPPDVEERLLGDLLGLAWSRTTRSTSPKTRDAAASYRRAKAASSPRADRREQVHSSAPVGVAPGEAGTVPPGGVSPGGSSVMRHHVAHHGLAVRPSGAARRR